MPLPATHSRLPIALLLLRWSTALVLFMWTIDKFLHPDHAAKVYEKYYFIGGLGSGVMLVVGTLEMALLIAFVAGACKRVSYGLVCVIHAVSTFSAFKMYLTPFEPMHLLFFAAWPMLAACVALYLLRDADTLFSFDSRARSAG